MAKINGNFKIRFHSIQHYENSKFKISFSINKHIQNPLQTLTNQRKRFRRFIFLLIIISLFRSLKLEL